MTTMATIRKVRCATCGELRGKGMEQCPDCDLLMCAPCRKEHVCANAPRPDDTTACVHPNDAIMWNPYNLVHQCHACGVIFIPATELPDNVVQAWLRSDPARAAMLDARDEMARAWARMERGRLEGGRASV